MSPRAFHTTAETKTRARLLPLPKLALRVTGLRGPAVALLQRYRAWRRERAIQQWRKALERDGAQIYPTLEFTGVPAPLPWITGGDQNIIERDVTLWISPDAGANPQLTLGAHLFIGCGSYIGVYQPISLGAHTLIGAYCYLISANHDFTRRDIPIQQQGFTGEPIVIEEDVWLGTHVVVLPGVRIGKGAIVAAGSVVNRDIPPYQIWGGVPAKFIKERP